MKEEMVFVIDINNKQDEYALCMELITAIEKIETKELKFFSRNKAIRYGKINENFFGKTGLSKNRYSKLVSTIEEFLYREKKESREFFHKALDGASLFKAAQGFEVYYQVRVHFAENEDVIEIQYLLAMLQGLEKIAEKVGVFFVPFSDYYNSEQGDFSLYYKISHYLRFVRYENFFSAFKGKSEVIVASLSKKKAGVQKTFIPALEINSKNYLALSESIFSEKNDRSISRELLDIGDKILDKRFRRKSLNIRKLIWDGEQQGKYYSVLEYLLFSVLFNGKEESIEDIEGYLRAGVEVSEGLFQLMENIVQHSLLKKGIFSFRINENKSSKSRNDEQSLIVGIIDFNDRETMIDNFMKKEGVPGEKISKLKNQINISHFLKSFDGQDSKEVVEAWKEYREKYPVNCLGLPKLADNLKQYNAELFMKSSVVYFCEDRRYKYKYSYEKKSEWKDKKEENDKYYIPGTQYQITFPVSKKDILHHNSNIILNSIGNLKESDRSYAYFLDYSPEKIDILKDELFYAEINKQYIDDFERGKDRVVRRWIQKINDYYKKKETGEKKLFYFDVGDMCKVQPLWVQETFCKGVVASVLYDRNGVKYLALINGTKKFCEIFKNTILSQKSDEKINPYGVQTYLVGSNPEEELLLAGKGKKAIINNMIQFAFMKGVASSEDKPLYWKEKNKEDLMPFDVILEDDNKTIFDKYIEHLAKEELTDCQRAGYKITDTHMRLGSKVHLDSFYEISILLQKPRIAKKVAFQILKDLKEDSKIDIFRDNIVFFGYASYSRVILQALVEILYWLKDNKKNEEKEFGKVEFAVYQNDIIVQKQFNKVGPITKIYYSNSSLEENISSYKVIQIVPISSTLTTFKKMYSDFPGGEIVKNYTVFWVRDKNNDENRKETEPTDIEKSYWKEIVGNREIKTDIISPNPQYFCKGVSVWNDPLKCKRCYPENILDERALVETDSTSTVPSQQLEVEKKIENKQVRNEDDDNNDNRVIKLQYALTYGHVYRDRNHYQYYIDTSKYFNLEKIELKEWLKSVKDSQKGFSDSISRKLNIIVSPQHHTNVEFCNYVNNYYFDGVADIISFDAAKEYKSNILAKYADIRTTIENAHKIGVEISFIYVDDTIITGTTFRRINNLVHALLPEEIERKDPINEVFVLLNRLSQNSQKSYVENPKTQFHSYVDLKISSVRSYGTSCVMCGLRRNANLFQRRAATKYVSEYWNEKEYVYQETSFDEIDKNVSVEKKREGYFRMLCSHYASDMFEIKEGLGDMLNKVADLFLDLSDESKNLSVIYKEVFRNDKLLTIKSYLKVLNRPFFSFGKNFRQCMLDFMILLTECFLRDDFSEFLKGKDKLSDEKDYINEKKLREKIFKVYKLIKKEVGDSKKLISFISEYLLEGLTDLRSNYIIRKATLKNICRIWNKNIDLKEVDSLDAKRFFERLQIDIQRLINSSTDETKNLWMEYLLINGEEYPKYEKDLCDWPKCSLQQQFAVLMDEKFQKYFKQFEEEIFLENGRLYYDGTMKIVKKWYSNMFKDYSVKEIVEEVWDDYYIKNYVKFIKLNFSYNAKYKEPERESKDHICNMVKFLKCIKESRGGEITKYQTIHKHMKELLSARDKISLVMNVDNDSNTKNVRHEFYDISDSDSLQVKENVERDICKAIAEESFKRTGYFIGEGNVVIILQNNYEFLKEKNIKNIREKEIKPVYFHITCNTDDRKVVLIKIRRILMFRNQLLKLFEVDFNNNSMHVLAKQRIKAQQLVRDKAGDHTDKSDISAIQYSLQYKEQEEDFTEVRKWLLLKAYVNMRIARLYRWGWSEPKNKANVYIEDANNDYFRKPAKSIGECIFGEMYDENVIDLDSKDNRLKKEITPLNYFRIIDNIFTIKYSFFGKTGEVQSFEMLRDVLKNIECIKVGKRYYRSEYIVCIILDICFSAINNSKPWRSILKEEIVNRDPIKEYQYFKSGKDRCLLEIFTEQCQDNSDIYFLVFKNEVHSESAKTIKAYNHDIEKAVNFTEETSGLSLASIKCYIESIWEKSDDIIPVVFEYVEEDGKYKFLSKLPIIRKGKENE